MTKDGKRYSQLSIEEISIDYGRGVGWYDGDYMYVTSFYVAYFEKLPEEKEVIELVLAGGFHEDKKLGFRWIFK